MKPLLYRTMLLFGIVSCLILAVIAISKQNARPNVTSARVWINQSPPVMRLPFGENQAWSVPVGLPAPPFTIEVVARFSTTSSENALWGVLLNVYSTQPSAVLLSNDRHYFAPRNNLPSYFYHLHTAGQFNQVTLTITADNQAILALNGWIVWNAPLIFDAAYGEWALFATNSDRHVAVITWLYVALHQP